MVISDIARVEELRSRGYKTISEIADEISPKRAKVIFSTMDDRLIRIRQELPVRQIAIGNDAYYSPIDADKIIEEYKARWGKSHIKK